MKLLLISIALVAYTDAITPSMLGQDSHDYKAHHILDAHEKFKENLDLQNLLGLDENGHMVENTVDQLTHVKVFSKFMSQFNRTYGSQDEIKKRYSIFTDNMKKVYVLQQTEKGSAQYGATKYSDLTEQEFSQLLGLRTDMKPGFTLMRPAVIPDIDLPTEFDWRTKGAVTPVKDQKRCGSCWAFSVTGNLEGQYAIKHNELLSFSEQELVDCDLHDHGCNGGLPEIAYNSIQMLGGLDIESDYPYYGFERMCHFNKTKAKVTVTGANQLPENEDDIAKWLVKNGPVSVGVNAGPMQFYTGGVLHPFQMSCDPRGLNHAVLIVGYGVRTTRFLRRRQPYWIIKNTWGADWGENGYVRLFRGAGTCGINLVVTSAIID